MTQPPSVPYPPARINTLALVAFIAAFIVPVAAIVLGILAGRQLNIPGNRETGHGLARAALIIGIVSTSLQVLFFIVWFALLFYGISSSAGTH